MICLADSAEILLISCGVLCRKDKTMFLNRFFGRICAACVLVVVAAACDGGSDAVSDYGFDRAVYHPRHSGGFAVDGRSDGGASLMLTVHTPWQGADSVADARRLLLLAPGEDIPAGYTGQVVDGCARRIVAMSTTQIAMLATADSAGLAADALVGLSGLRYLSNDTLRSRFDDSADVGYEGNVDYEKLAALSPDLVLLYGITSASAMESKLESLGIPYTYIGEHADSTPLGKAEWIVAAGYIAGRGTQAERAMSHIENRYECLVRHIRQYLDSTQTELPSVMINAPYSGSWYMAGSESNVARMIADAGGRYIYSGNPGATSRPVDFEEVFLLADSADIWVNTGTATTMAELLAMAPRLAGTKPVVSGRVFNNTRRMQPGGGNDYFESGTVRPDVVLADLFSIFHPGAAVADPDSLYYYLRLQ